MKVKESREREETNVNETNVQNRQTVIDAPRGTPGNTSPYNHPIATPTLH